MNLLDEPIRVGKIEYLASKLTKQDAVTINETIMSHRLNEKETELLMELLQVNYILDVPDAEAIKLLEVT
jgi:hypothetical protein